MTQSKGFAFIEKGGDVTKVLQRDSNLNRLSFPTFYSLKPENILIDEDGYTKLCDYGLAIQPPVQQGASSIADDASSSSSVSSSSVTTKKEGNKGVATTTFFGTLEYSPPEFFAKQEYSGLSDLWAFGCLLYEFVVGVPPFFDLKGNKKNTVRRICSKSSRPRKLRR